MKRLVFSLPLAFAFAALGTPGAARDGAKVRIDHQDGTGTKTIVDVHPSIPGVAEFIRATPIPIPKPGELIVPPSSTSKPSPDPEPTPHPY